MQNGRICTIHTNIIYYAANMCSTKKCSTKKYSTKKCSTKKAYQHNSQHGCNKCPDCIASKSRRQPAAGCEMLYITTNEYAS